MTTNILTTMPPAVNPQGATVQPPDPTGRGCSPHPRFADEFLNDLIGILESGDWPDRLWLYRNYFDTNRLRAWLYLFLILGERELRV